MEFDSDSIDNNINMDDIIFASVKQFAQKYGLHMLTNDTFMKKPTLEEKDKYYIYHEWTDGDELTFYVKKRSEIKYDNDENTCSASVDDWEKNRHIVICERLKKACILHGIIEDKDV